MNSIYTLNGTRIDDAMLAEYGLDLTFPEWEEITEDEIRAYFSSENMVEMFGAEQADADTLERLICGALDIREKIIEEMQKERVWEDVASVEDVTDLDDLIYTDLQEEAEEYEVTGGAWMAAHYVLHSSATALTILFLPDEQRAGIAHGADADWTDATGIEDAFERYFGIAGKEMVN